MTKAQKQKILDLVEKDCTLAHFYADGKGNYCVIGCLLKEAGVPDRQLIAGRPLISEAHSDESIQFLARTPCRIEFCDVWLTHLAQEYGLGKLSAIELQRANDQVITTPEERRQAVKNVLNSFEVED